MIITNLIVSHVSVVLLWPQMPRAIYYLLMCYHCFLKWLVSSVLSHSTNLFFPKFTPHHEVILAVTLAVTRLLLASVSE